MNTQVKLIYAAMREDFALFVQRVFSTVSPADELIWGEYLDAIAYFLTECINGNIKRAVITLPPRHMKSIFASVALPAYLLGLNPAEQIICASYAKELSYKLAADTRRVMEEDWYQKIFPAPALYLAQSTQNKIVTAENGFRYATTVGGSMTGIGANFIIIDDPHKADDAGSDLKLRNAFNWHSQTVLSRLNNKKKGVIILLQQRLHQADLAGHLIDQGGWHHLNLPAIAEKDEKILIAPNKYFHRLTGEALHPERESLEDLDKRKYEMGEYAFAAQYQQRPSPLGGGLVKTEWFKTYYQLKHPMHAEHIIQSWDTAVSASESADYSVCTTWYAIQGELFLVDIFREKIEFPKLCDIVMAQAKKYQATTVLIESAGVGQALYKQVHELVLKSSPWPFQLWPDRPDTDKASRLMKVAHIVNAGRVYLPNSAPWLEAFLDELVNFPNGLHDDQVDSLSLALKWADYKYLFQFK